MSMWVYVAGGVGIIALVLMLKLARRSRPDHETGGPTSGPPRGSLRASPRLLRDLETGNYEQAAQRELNAGNLEGAFELFLRAQKVSKAALIAEQLGKYQEAAELFERIGETGRAAGLYRQLGMALKADELQRLANAQVGAQASGGGPAGTQWPASQTAQVSSPGGPSASSASLSFAAPKVAAHANVTFSGVEGPRERARGYEDMVAGLLQRIDAGDAEARLLVGSAAQQASDAWLAAGDLRRAADVCRRAGLLEQAVNIYANLLGEPGVAAALLAERGEHRRAAELFEIAGQRERALAAWVDWSKTASDPLEHVAAVSRLGHGAVEKLVIDIVQSHPLSLATANLHYRAACSLADHGSPARAVPLLEHVISIVPDLPGAGERLSFMRQLIAISVSAGPLPLLQTLPPAVGVDRDAAGPRVVVPVGLQLQVADLERLAAEAAAHAVQRAMTLAMASAAAERHKSMVSRGLERSDVPMSHANDPAVQLARSGASINELENMINGRPTDLINIEVYYRLALALVAAGRWEEARHNFALVEDTSRGYRDAKRRAEEIANWQDAVEASRARRVQVATPAGGPFEGRYTLLGELGRGGMAVVYRARDETLGREVALKFIAEGVAGDERLRGLFEREARSVASLNHPNIVTVYDVGTLAGRPFICMELVEGTTLEQELELHGQLKILDAMRVSEQVLAALHYAHERKIMHRDVKPANMMRTKRGLVKLMDFGLAKSTESRDTTIVSGTPAYMSPEQLVGRNVDGRADIFAVGASMYQMMTGQFAFDSLRRDKPPATLSSLSPGVPKLLEWAVHRSMEFDAGARFATAGEMREVLLDILRAATQHARNRDGANS